MCLSLVPDKDILVVAGFLKKSMKLRRIAFCILIIHLLFLESCSRYIIAPAHVKLPKYGSFAMLTGTRQGCNSAFSSRGNSMYRTFFKLELDSNQIEDPEYFDSWYRGYILCFHLVNRRAFSSIDTNIEPEHAWFWNKGKSGNPKIGWALDQGIKLPGQGGGGIKLPGQKEGWHWNTHLFGGNCQGIWQCAK